VAYGFDIVAVGIEHEGGVIGGVVLGPAQQLLAWHVPDKEDRYAPLKLADFLAKAWKPARELGWIV
jgi:hypothetical protein